MKMKTLLLKFIYCSLYLILGAAYASESRPEGKLDSFTPIHVKVLWDSSITSNCEDLLRPANVTNLFEALTNQVNANVGSLEVPKKVPVLISDHDVEPHLAGSGLIVIPHSLIGTKALEPIFQHEYGHKIFQKNFSKYIQLAHQEHTVTKWIKNIFGRRLWPFVAVADPYEELFCDVVSVLSQKDPDAIANAMSHLRIDQKSDENRSFTGSFFDAHWSNHEAHAYFSPTRKFLWHKYFSLAKNAGQEGEMIERLYRLIVRQIVIHSRSDAFHSPTPSEANAKLMRSIERDFIEFSESE